MSDLASLRRADLTAIARRATSAVLVLSMSLALLPVFPASPAAAAGTWVAKTAMSARNGHTVAANGAKVYVVGGWSSQAGHSGTVQIYDTVTNTWSSGTPRGLGNRKAGGVINGILYEAGGNDGAVNVNTVQAYNTGTNSWSTKSPMSTARGDMAAGVIGGKLYLAGGFITGGGWTGLLEAFDPAANAGMGAWTTLAPMLTPRSGAGGGVVNGKLYVVGGFNGAYLGTLEVFDPAANAGAGAWATLPSMTTPRSVMATAVVDARLYVIGGQTTGNGFTAAVEAYDPVANTWTTDTTMPTPRGYFGAAAVGGTVYALGGEGGGPTLGTNEAFTPSAPAPAATATTLTSSLNPANVGQSVTFAATVTSGASPVTTGTVTFKDGATSLASGVVLSASGVATYSTTTLSAGTHGITAVYSGTASFAASTSAALTQVVNDPNAPAVLATVAMPAEVRMIAVNSTTHRAFAAVGDGFNAATFHVSVIDGTVKGVDIPVGAGDFVTGPTHIALNAQTNRVYVNHTGMNFASVIDAAANTRVAILGTGAYPEGIGTDPGKARLYIANTNSGNLHVYDTTSPTPTFLAAVPFPGTGAGITNLYLAVIPAMDRVFVSAPGVNKIFAVNSLSHQIVATYAVSGGPRNIVADATRQRLYVERDFTTDLVVLDATTGVTVATIPLGGTGNGVAVDPTIGRVYATTQTSPLLRVIDSSANTVLNTLDLGVDLGAGMGVDTTDHVIYVATAGAAKTVKVLKDPNVPAPAANQAPTANAISVTTLEDTAAAVTLTGTDPEGSALAFSVVTTPAHGALSGTAPNLTYTPAANYNGPDSFTYKANDGALDSNVATVSLTVTPVNDAPAAANDAYATAEDTVLTVAAPGVLANDTDIDSPTLTAAIVAGPSHGTLTLNANGSFTYTPALNYNGPDSFTYTASDGLLSSNVATVSITVTAVNDAPTADATSATTAEDTVVLTTLRGADVEGAVLTFTVVTPPAHGSLIVSVATAGAVVDGVSSVSLRYTPAADYNGPDSFTYKANDGALDSNVATVSITVTAVNDAPGFTKGADQTVLEDAGAQTVVGWATAISAGPADEAAQTLAFQVSTDNAALFSAAPAISASGTLTYTPAANANGSATVTVTLKDSGGTTPGVDTSAAQTFTIAVSAVNDAPSFAPIADRTDEAATDQAITVTGISTGPADEAAQTLTWAAASDSAAVSGATVEVTPVGTVLRYRATAIPRGTARVTVTATDSGGTLNGGSDTYSQTFIVTVLDRTAPVVSVVGPAADDVIASSPATVTVQATDAVGVSALSVNGVAATRVAGTPQSGTWSASVPVTLPVALGGALTFTATGSDAAGNGAVSAPRVIDNDGIAAAIDGSPNVFSNDFTDGTTSGAIADRATWTLSAAPLASAPGVGLSVAGSGGVARIATCGAGGAEQILLDRAGEKANVLCVVTTAPPALTGSRVTAVVASPRIEVQKVTAMTRFFRCGFGTCARTVTFLQSVAVPQGQTVTIGSPLTAAAENTAPVSATLHDEDGALLASLTLQPGTSVGIDIEPGETRWNDRFTFSVLAGTAVITIGDETVTLGAGQSATKRLDETPPMTTAAVDRPANAAGWNNTDVTVTFGAADNAGGSGVASTTIALDGVPVNLVDGAVRLSAEGTHVLTFSSTDVAGNVEDPKTLTIRIDKTPAEGGARFDPVALGLAVFGRDALSGIEGVALISTAPAPKSGPVGGDKAERRTYRITDNAGNVTSLVVDVRSAGHQIKAALAAVSYKGGQATAFSDRVSFEWSLEGGALRELEQDIEIRTERRGRDDDDDGDELEVSAKFEAKKGTTTITTEGRGPESKIVRTGLVLLELVTEAGGLRIAY